MKKILSLLVVCIVLGGGGYYIWATQFNDGFSDIIKTSETSKIKLSSDIHSKTILLQNLSTGKMLIEKNETKEVEIASLTKLITAYLLLEAEANLEKTVTIDQRIIDDFMAEGASLSGYRSGDELTIEDLAYGIVLPSGGDAALVAANYVAGSEKDFVEKMNHLAKELKMTNTHFKNSTGLDARNHYSTVEDLSKFMNVALKNQNFRKLVTTTTYQTDGTIYIPEGYYIESTMLKDSADLSIANGQILGGKTGYTKKAEQCLISLAEIEGEYYLLITTGADGNPFTEQYNMADARLIYETIG
ncbi:D-alanyl-D-alanine carboxypeptidase family protein [Vagococcus fluvialis]|uniref:D-alanyl-D-alanine carboxypeptidase n=1 Tax=Vagococcus fluvialis TaxID=2738 RepID=A0A7X6D9N4_9ENTE|nr:serine hydrolase [Vagococcus fluvialis]NKC68371.1 D-alanyl-D-alanine carboxypeptidase [Vagococcus fluvialis]